ncbi:hypothetical protein J6590_052098 [Homalodisca vitripennis]|nr:hypothetical protein J6590_052098 [Homalodisca vitripennis]
MDEAKDSKWTCFVVNSHAQPKFSPTSTGGRGFWPEQAGVEARWPLCRIDDLEITCLISRICTILEASSRTPDSRSQIRDGFGFQTLHQEKGQGHLFVELIGGDAGRMAERVRMRKSLHGQRRRTHAGRTRSAFKI